MISFVIRGFAILPILFPRWLQAAYRAYIHVSSLLLENVCYPYEKEWEYGDVRQQWYSKCFLRDTSVMCHIKQIKLLRTSSQIIVTAEPKAECWILNLCLESKPRSPTVTSVWKTIQGGTLFPLALRTCNIILTTNLFFVLCELACAWWTKSRLVRNLSLEIYWIQSNHTFLYAEFEETFVSSVGILLTSYIRTPRLYFLPSIHKHKYVHPTTQVSNV